METYAMKGNCGCACGDVLCPVNIPLRRQNQRRLRSPDQPVGFDQLGKLPVGSGNPGKLGSVVGQPAGGHCLYSGAAATTETKMAVARVRENFMFKSMVLQKYDARRIFEAEKIWPEIFLVFIIACRMNEGIGEMCSSGVPKEYFPCGTYL